LITTAGYKADKAFVLAVSHRDDELHTDDSKPKSRPMARGQRPRGLSILTGLLQTEIIFPVNPEERQDRSSEIAAGPLLLSGALRRYSNGGRASRTVEGICRTATFAHSGSFHEAARCLVAALRDRLGLRMEPQKVRVQVLVIDAISRPSKN